MVSTVQKPLCNVYGSHAGLFLELGEAHDELMHAPVAVRHIVHTFETGEYVVRIEHRILPAFLETLAAHGEDEGIRL